MSTIAYPVVLDKAFREERVLMAAAIAFLNFCKMANRLKMGWFCRSIAIGHKQTQQDEKTGI